MMTKEFYADLPIIMNKYHRLDQPYNSFNRMAYHGWEYDSATGLDDDGILEKVAETCRENERLPRPVIKALAFACVLDNTRIETSEHDWYIGLYGWGRLIQRDTRDKWNAELFEHILPETADEMSLLSRSGTVTIWPDYDHTVPDWHAAFELGFPGLLERANNYHCLHKEQGQLTDEENAFFQGIEITYRAILGFIKRLKDRAESVPHRKSAGIAACLEGLLAGGPKDTYQALQFIYLYFMLSESVDGYQVRSLASGLDTALDPFIQADLAARRYTENEINDFIAYFLVQFASIDNYWGQPMYLGGSDANGNPLVNETTYRILDIYDSLSLFNPKIQLKISHNTPDKLLDKTLDMIRRGHNSIVFMCEPGIVRAMMSMGVPYSQAVTCDIKGCYEYSVRGLEVSSGQVFVNLAKLVSFVLHNGKDPVTGEQIGLKTGELSSLAEFDDFWLAYLKQVEAMLECSMSINDTFEPYLTHVNPSNMFSATIESALIKKQDAYQTGSKYNNSVVLFTGFASAIDALMAIRHFIYETKQISLADLKTILDNNWQGNEKLRMLMQGHPAKFGNNHRDADLYAHVLSERLTNQVNNRQNARGGFYKAAMHSARQYLDQGKVTEATADGRKAGEELSKNSSAVMGMDRNGVTSLIKSALALQPSRFTEDFGFDVMLHESATQGNDGLRAMRSLVKSYMDANGVSIQFNVFNAEKLRDAQKNPDNYRNLQVRVCGWNVLWNTMTADEQEAFIARAEAIMR